MRPRPLALLMALLPAAGCAGAPPPAPPAGRMLGYGTPGVSAYAPGDRPMTLGAMLARCEGVGPPAAGATEGLAASCAQLRRTLRNQPGNAVPGTGGALP